MPNDENHVKCDSKSDSDSEFSSDSDSDSGQNDIDEDEQQEIDTYDNDDDEDDNDHDHINLLGHTTNSYLKRTKGLCDTINPNLKDSLLCHKYEWKKEIFTQEHSMLVFNK